MEAFDGNGVVRVYENVDGAVLLERLSPGRPLVAMSVDGRDEEATSILADVIEQMSVRKPLPACATVEEWAKGFELYSVTGDDQIPKALVEEGRQLYSELCATQREPRLLHGDLHHDNVLFDSRRGWVAIDPKAWSAKLSTKSARFFGIPMKDRTSLPPPRRWRDG